MAYAPRCTYDLVEGDDAEGGQAVGADIGREGAVGKSALGGDLDLLEGGGGQVGEPVRERELEGHLAGTAMTWGSAMLSLEPVVVGGKGGGDRCEAEQGGGCERTHCGSSSGWYA